MGRLPLRPRRSPGGWGAGKPAPNVGGPNHFLGRLIVSTHGKNIPPPKCQIGLKSGVQGMFNNNNKKRHKCKWPSLRWDSQMRWQKAHGKWKKKRRTPVAPISTCKMGGRKKDPGFENSNTGGRGWRGSLEAGDGMRYPLMHYRRSSTGAGNCNGRKGTHAMIQHVFFSGFASSSFSAEAATGDTRQWVGVGSGGGTPHLFMSLPLKPKGTPECCIPSST